MLFLLKPITTANYLHNIKNFIKDFKTTVLSPSDLSVTKQLNKKQTFWA